MTDYLITPPDYLLDQWSAEYFHIETHTFIKDPAVSKQARHDLFTKIARWGAQEISEPPMHKLRRLVEEGADRDQLLGVVEQLEGLFDQQEES